MKKIKFGLVLCAALISLNAQASGDEGHKTIGAIADRLLVGTNAGARVKALLQPGESLQSISIWADCAKGTFCGPQTSEMIAFTIQNPAHAAYHYTNTPVDNKAYVAGGVGTTDHDIVQTLKQAIAVLQGNDNEKTNPHRFTPRQALLMIAHLLGDIHQPLHVGAVYLNQDNQFVTPATQAQVDGVNVFNVQGGNNLLIEDQATWTARDLKNFKPEASNGNAARVGKPLHLYWDVTVVENVMRDLGVKSVSELTDKLISAQTVPAANKGDPVSWPEQWATEGLYLAKSAYADIVIVDKVKVTNRRGVEYANWYSKLPPTYIQESTEVTRKQLAVAGHRLAALLKSIWP